MSPMAFLSRSISQTRSIARRPGGVVVVVVAAPRCLATSRTLQPQVWKAATRTTRQALPTNKKNVTRTPMHCRWAKSDYDSWSRVVRGLATQTEQKGESFRETLARFQQKTKEALPEEPTKRNDDDDKDKDKDKDAAKTTAASEEEAKESDAKNEESSWTRANPFAFNNMDWQSVRVKALSSWDEFRSQVGDTWQELVTAHEPKSVNKKLGSATSATFEEEDNAASAEQFKAMMVIDPSKHASAWERMQRRLYDAPIIQQILTQASEVYEKSGLPKAQRRLEDLREDAREAWETSQNPWVYRISSVYDTLTAETEYAMALRELQQLDPSFTLEDWKRDVVDGLLPDVMRLFLEGRIRELQPWLGEAVYNRMTAEARARKQDGVYVDANVLAIMNADIIACEPDTVNHGSPILLLHFMCQQINCVRRRETDEVVEGSEDDVRANSYLVAFQREYLEETQELQWKIVDFRFNGATAYL